MKITTPAKIILSGEHSIIYGQPALTVAIDQPMLVSIREIEEPKFYFKMPLLLFEKSYTFLELVALHSTISLMYEDYKKSERPFRSVFQSVDAYLMFMVAHVFLAFKETPHKGYEITVESTFPIGCGMGSSAALALSVVSGFVSLISSSCSHSFILQLAREIEEFQHVKTSGIDLHTCYYGGYWYFLKENPISWKGNLHSFYLVNSGQPSSSTGECVQKVRKDFNESHPIWKQFGMTTHNLWDAFQHQMKFVPRLLHTNHQLLCEIGVVSQTVIDFIEAIEQTNGGGKITGAGTIKGEGAGVVLVYCPSELMLADLCLSFGYTYQPLQVSFYGTKLL